MSVPDILSGTYIRILVGNGATPEVFTAICGITTRTYSHQVNTSDAFIRDCDDPDELPFRRIVATGEQWDLSGSGHYNRAQRALVDAATGVTKSYRFVLTEPADDEVDAGYYAGPAMLTQVNLGGGDEGFGTVELTIASNGRWSWTDV